MGSGEEVEVCKVAQVSKPRRSVTIEPNLNLNAIALSRFWKLSNGGGNIRSISWASIVPEYKFPTWGGSHRTYTCIIHRRRAFPAYTRRTKSMENEMVKNEQNAM